MKNSPIKNIITHLPMGLFSIALLVLPFVYTTQLMDPVLLSRFGFIVPVFLIILVLLLLFEKTIPFYLEWQFPHNKYHKSSYLYFLSITYLLLTATGLVYAHNTTEVYMELARSIVFIVGLNLLVGLSIKRPHYLDILAKTILCSTFLIALLGLIDFVQLQGQLGQHKFTYGIQSLMAHKNLMASALFMGMPLSIYLLFADRNGWKVLSLLNLLLSFLLIIVVQSRAVWLAIMGSGFIGLVAFMIWLAAGKSNVAKSKIIKTGLFTVVFLLVGGVILQTTYLSKISHSNSLKNRITSMVDFKNVANEHTATINERLALWQNTMEIIKDKPLLGVGGSNWKIHFPSKGLNGLRAEQGIVHFQRPHNDFLWIWSEKGIFGLLIWLGFFVYAMICGIAFIRRTHSEKQQALVLLSLLGLIGYGIISFFDFPYERCLHLLYLAIYLAIPISLALGNYEASNKNDSFYKLNWLHFFIPLAPFKGGTFIPPLKGARRMTFYDTNEKFTATNNLDFRRNALTGLFLLSLMALVVFAYRIKGEESLLDALKMRATNKQQAIPELMKVQNAFFKMDATAIPIDWYIGELFYQQGQLEQARFYFSQSVKAHPYQLNALNNLATTEFALKDKEAAMTHYKQALKLAPRFGEANLNLAALYFNEQDYDQALHYLLQCPPDLENQRYLVFLSKIFPKRLQKLAPKVKNPLVLQKLQDLSTDVTWMSKIHNDLLIYPEKNINQHIIYNILFILSEQVSETEAAKIKALF